MSRFFSSFYQQLFLLCKMSLAVWSVFKSAELQRTEPNESVKSPSGTVSQYPGVKAAVLACILAGMWTPGPDAYASYDVVLTIRQDIF